MPLRIQNGGPDTVLREEFVGSSTQRICYPGISSCISITGVLASGLIGTHITAITEIDLIDDLLQTMKAGGGGNCQSYYVIGAIAQFKQGTNQEFNTRKKIKNRIHSALNPNAVVRFYDTSAHSASVHVFVEKIGLTPNFYWITSTGHNVNGFVYPTFGGRTQINPMHFVIR